MQVPQPRQRIFELYAQRDPLYREVADIIIDTSRQNVHLLVSRLLSKLASPAGGSSPPCPALPHDNA